MSPDAAAAEALLQDERGAVMHLVFVLFETLLK